MLDELTKLPSLSSLEEMLGKLAHPKLMLIDLKDFKEINLKYSDFVGDLILKEFAKNLQEYANKNEMHAFRVREDEFALVKDMPFNLAQMEQLLFDLLDFMKEQSFNYKDENIKIEAHIGLCLDQMNLLKKARRALIVAQKEDQPFVTYSEFVNSLLEENKEKISAILEESIANGTIMPYYQKIVDKDNNTAFFEMLLRNETKNSIQTPKFFLKIAHEKGFYNQIVKSVSKKIDTKKHTISINLSANDFFDDNLFEFLLDYYGNTKAIFEIQNDKYINNEGLEKRLHIIKENNIKICLDNVSKEDEIKAFDNSLIDFIKVAQTQTRLIKISQTSYDTCKSIVSTCKDLNIKSIASHIISQEIYEVAKEIGFDYFQGYFIGKPTPSDSSFAE
jgi:diguanylate cyclase (GGDEF)-like protein